MVAQILTAGFFASCALDDTPERQRASGFQDIGLPYETDTAVTRHLAAFLQRQSNGESPARPPTHVLFNGGVFKADRFRSVLLERLSQWYADSPPQLLQGDQDLDFAVARGAAYYAWSGKNGGVRIRGGTARSYYIGIETAGLAIPGAPRPLAALCVVPSGMEEGSETDVPSAEIGLVVGEPARFRFFGSAVRQDDVPGQRLNRWSPEELVETDSMQATLEADDAFDDSYVPVQFRSRITELGVLELWCVHVPSGREWKLEFSVRDDATEVAAS